MSSVFIVTIQTKNDTLDSIVGVFDDVNKANDWVRVVNPQLLEDDVCQVTMWEIGEIVPVFIPDGYETKRC